MQTVSAALRAALDSDHYQPCARLLSLAADGTIRATWDAADKILLGGDVRCDRTSPIRRSATIELANPTGALSPLVPGDYFYPGSRIRAERGAVLAGVPTFSELFTGDVATFGTTMRGHLSITADDVLGACQQPFGEVVSIEAGMTAEAIALAFLEPVLGDGSAWSLDGNGQTLATARTWAEDDDRLGSAVALFADMGLELFADRTGNIVLRPVPDPTTLAVARTYGPGDFLDLSRAGALRAVNRQVAIGNTATDTIRAQVDVDDPSSPVNAGRIGLRVAPYIRSAMISTQDQANAVARAAMARYSLRQESITGNLPPDPTLDEGDVIEVSEPISGANGRYWLATVGQPIVMGPMSVSGPAALPLFST